MINVGFLIVNRANWARCRTVIEALISIKDFQATVYACSSMNLEKFGNAIDQVTSFDSNVRVRSLLSAVAGEGLESQALSAGLLTIQLSGYLKEDEVDALVVVADRYEITAGAIAATYQNIPLIHIQGGEVSGNIDNKVRFAVSALADLHFPATDEAKDRLQRSLVTGSIHNFGCPAMDLVIQPRTQRTLSDIFSHTSHTGEPPVHGEDYALVAIHPDTEAFDQRSVASEEIYAGIAELSQTTCCVVLWPNIDAGSDTFSKAIRRLREKAAFKKAVFVKNFHPEDYVEIIRNAAICVGNSSSFLREGSVLGKRVVLIGDRQRGRDKYSDLVEVDADRHAIVRGGQAALTLNASPSMRFGDGTAGEKIAHCIKNYLNGTTPTSE